MKKINRVVKYSGLFPGLGFSFGKFRQWATDCRMCFSGLQAYRNSDWLLSGWGEFNLKNSLAGWPVNPDMVYERIPFPMDRPECGGRQTAQEEVNECGWSGVRPVEAVGEVARICQQGFQAFAPVQVVKASFSPFGFSPEKRGFGQQEPISRKEENQSVPGSLSREDELPAEPFGSGFSAAEEKIQARAEATEVTDQREHFFTLPALSSIVGNKERRMSGRLEREWVNSGEYSGYDRTVEETQVWDSSTGYPEVADRRDFREQMSEAGHMPASVPFSGDSPRDFRSYPRSESPFSRLGSAGLGNTASPSDDYSWRSGNSLLLPERALGADAAPVFVPAFVPRAVQVSNHIGNLVGSIAIHTTTLGVGLEEVREQVVEVLKSAVNDFNSVAYE